VWDPEKKLYGSVAASRECRADRRNGWTDEQWISWMFDKAQESIARFTGYSLQHGTLRAADNTWTAGDERP
jgi:hypothetical protein